MVDLPALFLLPLPLSSETGGERHCQFFRWGPKTTSLNLGWELRSRRLTNGHSTDEGKAQARAVREGRRDTRCEAPRRAGAADDRWGRSEGGGVVVVRAPPARRVVEGHRTAEGVAEATMTTAADASGKGYAGIENYLHDLQYRKSKKTVLHSVTSECERDERDAAARVRRGSRSDPTSRD